MRTKPSGKRTAVWAATLGAALLASAALLYRDRIAESYYLRQLERGSRMDRAQAADRLAGMRSERALPLLLRAIEEECLDDERIVLHDCEDLLQPFSRFGDAALPVLTERLRTAMTGRLDESAGFLPALFALERTYRHEARDEVDVSRLLSEIARDPEVPGEARDAAAEALRASEDREREEGRKHWEVPPPKKDER